MNRFVSLLLWCCSLLSAWAGYAQQSSNVVDYQVTYDLATSRYTAWVVPRYSVPNSTNTGTTERGGTAQFTIKVPASFVISNITDVRGTWDKSPLRLGPGNPGQDWSGTGLDPNVNYYVIGKSPSETNYGPFVNGTPVALFTFQGNGCFGPISPLEPGNPFIAAADQRFALNVANSFYSVSGQPPGGNQNPLEQFRTVAGPPAQCSTLVANPDSQTLIAGASITIPVLANDTNNGQPASVTSLIVTVNTPNSGTATVNANGTLNYVAAPGFSGPVSFTYTICDQLQPTVCSSAVVSLTVLSATPQPADLLITKQVSQSLVAVGSSLSFTLTVQNLGPGGAVGVSVQDALVSSSSALLQGTPTPSRGSFDATSGIWTVGNLGAGETATLVLTLIVQREGVLTNTASVTATGSQDPNAANNTASSCASVPVRLCTGEEFIASVPNTYQNVQWYRNGVLFTTGSTATITEIGVYTVTSTNGTCPISGCCPIIVESANCCPADLCVPLVIRKTRTRL